jgi:hypothetical protein
MITVDTLAQAAIQRDALAVRSAAQDLLHTYPRIEDIPFPASLDLRLQIVAAALTELLAERTHQQPPPWTANLGMLDEPFHLLASAIRMPRLRATCERESPEPLRRRKLYAPADYLTFA